MPPWTKSPAEAKAEKDEAPKEKAEAKAEAPKEKAEAKAEAPKEKAAQRSNLDKITPRVIKLISATISDLADDDGWAFLGDVGNLLQKKQPNFDSRNYGFLKLTPLIRSIERFDIEQRESPKGKFKLIYVKNKEKPGRRK